jgi:LPS-assembly lipoprotein
MNFQAANLVGIILIPLLLLSGCGFKPIYGDSTKRQISLGSVVYSEVIPSRVISSLRAALKNEFPNSSHSESEYKLDINIISSTEDAAVQSNTVVTRKNIVVYCDIKLTNTKSGKVVFTDRAVGIESFNTNRSPFSEHVSEEEIKNRMMKTLAKEIKNRLILAFDAPHN